MTRRLPVLLSLIAALLAVALPAAAQTPDEVASEVADRTGSILLPADEDISARPPPATPGPPVVVP
jgi:hypothetical protein